MDLISIRRIDDSGIYTRNACLYVWVHSSWQPGKTTGIPENQYYCSSLSGIKQKGL